MPDVIVVYLSGKIIKFEDSTFEFTSKDIADISQGGIFKARINFRVVERIYYSDLNYESKFKETPSI